jgi:di/tripeptidase
LFIENYLVILFKINQMNLDLLKEVLSLPSVSGDESMVRDYIIEYAKTNNIDYYVDKKGNLYLTKGSDYMTSGEYYPCVVAHMDTVHRSHSDLIENKVRLKIESSVYNEGEEGEFTTLIAKHPETDAQTGIGGDDKCGVYVCLEMFNRFDVLKGAFFVEEEIGMKGSKEADDNFFSNVGYAIQFDAPSSNWISEVCSGVRLFDDEFKGEIKGTLNECGYTNFSNDPFTDVNQLASKYDFNCLNLGCGYYRQHSNSEYVVVNEVYDSINAGEKLISKLGLIKYVNKKVVKKPILNESNYNYGYDFDEYDEYVGDEFDEVADTLTDFVLELYKNGISEFEIKEEVSKFLRDMY